MFSWVSKLKLTLLQLNIIGLICDGLFTVVALIYSALPFDIVVYAVIRLSLTTISVIAHVIAQIKANQAEA